MNGDADFDWRQHQPRSIPSRLSLRVFNFGILTVNLVLILVSADVAAEASHLPWH